jgi:hypothetical protein
MEFHVWKVEVEPGSTFQAGVYETFVAHPVAEFCLDQQKHCGLVYPIGVTHPVAEFCLDQQKRYGLVYPDKLQSHAHRYELHQANHQRFCAHNQAQQYGQIYSWLQPICAQSIE